MLAVPTHPLPVTHTSWKLGGFDDLFNALWTHPVDKSLSQESSLSCSQEYAAWHEEPTCAQLDKNDLATCQGLPVSFLKEPLDKREVRRAGHSQIWAPQHWGNFLASISLNPSYTTQRASLELLHTGWQVGLVPPPGALGGSPAESALAASAFSVISLNSWERAKCQKCLQVNSLSLSSASDLHWWLISVFIFCWEGLSVRSVNRFQV